jgi:hypothetical protein
MAKQRGLHPVGAFRVILTQMQIIAMQSNAVQSKEKQRGLVIY